MCSLARPRRPADLDSCNAPEPAKPRGDIASAWSATLKALAQSDPPLEAQISTGRPGELKGDRLVIHFEPRGRFVVEQLQEAERFRRLEEEISRHFGRRISLRLELDTPASGEEAQAPGQNPMVEDALQLFDGAIVDVRKTDPQEGTGRRS